MAKQDRCPICDVPVKAENILRHLDANHPRHPQAASVREDLRADAKYAPRRDVAQGFRPRPWHAAVAASVALLVLAAIFVPPFLDPYRDFGPESCTVDADTIYHIHPSLRILIQGTPYPIPASIGNQPGCMYPLHTHAGSDPSTGIVQIHVESPIIRDFKLGDFFLVWGAILTPTQVLGYADDGTNRVTMAVSGAPSTAFGSLPLQDGQLVEIAYGPAA